MPTFFEIRQQAALEISYTQGGFVSAVLRGATDNSDDDVSSNTLT